MIAAAFLRDRRYRSGYDSVHSVDDRLRTACSETLDDEQGATCAAFLERAIAYFAAHGIPRIERLITDNAWAYRLSLRQFARRTASGGSKPPISRLTPTF